jgi:uroporphyrin-III C-methyltransferase
LPNLLRIFTASDQVVRCEPVKAEDVALAEQATNYINYVFNKDNPGFSILYTWFKDALLEKNGISVEIVPGITSGIAAPTYFGIPLTHRDAASSVTFVTGHERVDKEKKTVNWRDLAKSSDSLVIFMGIKNIEFIVEELILGGLDKSTKCAVIQEATLKNQKCLIEKLDNLPDKIKDKEFLAPSIIIIGKIVEFKVNNNITKVSDVYLPDINKVQLYNKSQK